MKATLSLQFYLLNLFGSLTTALAYSKDNRRVIDQTPMTIRVITGQTASLPCTVDPRYTEQHADKYKVIWVNPSSTAISIQDRRILNDVRISVERPLLRDWNLHIRNVSLTDTGVYRCQINTRPVGTKRVELIVNEPPSITDHTKPNEIERPEKDTIELFCNATGTPPPDITWYRLNRRTTNKRESVGKGGEVLVIHNVTKECADTYECVADNDVPPSISHSFKITIQYAPEVHLPNTRLGQYVGKDTTLECEVNAFPLGTVVWRYIGKKKGSMSRVMSNTLTSEVNLYSKLDDSVILSLGLQQITEDDFGFYECTAQNPRGTTSKSMELYEIPSKRRSSTVTTEAAKVDSNEDLWNSPRHRNRDENGRNGDGNGKNMGLVSDSQHADLYGGHSNGRDYGPSDGSSKYTSVINNDSGSKNGCPSMTSVTLTSTLTAVSALLAIVINVL